MVDVGRLWSHVEWLRGDHENCNPFIADDIATLLTALQAIQDALPAVSAANKTK